MFEKYKEKVKELSGELENIRGYLDVPAKEKKYEALREQSMSPGFWENNEQARKTMKEMDRVKSDVDLYNELNRGISDTRTLIELAEEEDESSLEGEIKNNIKKLENSFARVTFRLKMSGEHDRSSAIVTLNAGAGGTEACDWVEMLTRMYTQWAAGSGYKTTITDILPGEEAGIKSVTFIIEGEYAYGYLQGETGIHRLVRISPFDSGGRRHTSFASCDIIPRIEEDIEIDINDSDLRIDTYRAGGHGGQHVNKTDSAVRITHDPTGIVVQCQDSPSQHANKKTAMDMLKAKLYEFEKDKQRDATQRRYDEKGDIGWGNQIRSYVFMPYQMVKDHRTDVKVSNVDAVMDGEIDEFIEGYLQWQADENTK
ncbi:MAG: peptide chain release factor 2 [Elusimicrobiota bacterium]|nr:peptide chain release factor 2 [Elusimicrobiota bacterium]